MNENESHAAIAVGKERMALNRIGWGGFIAIFIVSIVYGYWEWPLEKDSPFDRLNTLFSGLAFWGVVFAIFLQKAELKLQREELILTRHEVRGQKEQLESQNTTLKQQRFENTFFSLLNLFNNIISSMEVTMNAGSVHPTIYKGRESFIQFLNDFKREYKAVTGNTNSPDVEPLCRSAYARFADYRQTSVGHYFRTLYNIVKFIDHSDIKDKQTYLNILRAQLSSSELTLLFYNCVTYGKAKEYVEKFGLLENMVFTSLSDPAHKNLYKESAFKSP